MNCMYVNYYSNKKTAPKFRKDSPIFAGNYDTNMTSVIQKITTLNIIIEIRVVCEGPGPGSLFRHQSWVKLAFIKTSISSVPGNILLWDVIPHKYCFFELSFFLHIQLEPESPLHVPAVGLRKDWAHKTPVEMPVNSAHLVSGNTL